MESQENKRQDGIVTPRSLPVLPLGAEGGPSRPTPSGGDNARPRPPSRALWAAVFASLVLSLLALATSAFVVGKLWSVRQTALNGLDAAIAGLDDLSGEGVHFDYHFSGTIPFSGEVPIRQDLVFPFQGKIPIDTTVQVPIDAGILGTFTIDVPIQTSLDVDLELPIAVDQAIQVETEVPLDVVIPVDLRGDDPVLAGLIERIRGWLVDLRRSL